MLRQTLVLPLLLGAVAITGCSAGASFNPRTSSGSSSETERTQLAAYAATTEYPRDVEATDDLHAAAIVNRDRNTIRILNFSDRPIRDVNIWVNGSFVKKVDLIPPNGSITVHRADFFDTAGHSLANQSASTNRVEIQIDNKLHNLQGPVYE